MSWQSYVDDHLIGTGHVVQGAICGVDGAIWAVSAGFNVRPRASRGPVPSLSLTSQDKQGIFAWKAATCVVIGTHGENIQGNNCNTCVGNLADYLLNSGM